MDLGMCNKFTVPHKVFSTSFMHAHEGFDAPVFYQVAGELIFEVKCFFTVFTGLFFVISVHIQVSV